ncbi:MAG: DUF2917 domain-containing protein [Pseudomonadota bacterium]|nr:DUF2917 domain-containing protein [Pseudomonadota bacterium]
MALLTAARWAFQRPAHAAGQPVLPVLPVLPGQPAALVGATNPVKNQPGHCRLEPGQALTMQARQAGWLRVVQGRLWVTFSNAGQDSRVRAGDHFLLPGERLALSAGQAVVMESWAIGPPAPAQVCWEPAPVPGLLPVFRSARRPAACAPSASRLSTCG